MKKVKFQCNFDIFTDRNDYFKNDYALDTHTLPTIDAGGTITYLCTPGILAPGLIPGRMGNVTHAKIVLQVHYLRMGMGSFAHSQEFNYDDVSKHWTEGQPVN